MLAGRPTVREGERMQLAKHSVRPDLDTATLLRTLRAFKKGDFSVRMRQRYTGIGAEVQRLAESARAGTLRPEELRGSTFSVTSAGKLGGLVVTPLINHPEVGILGVHRIGPRPVEQRRRQLLRLLDGERRPQRVGNAQMLLRVHARGDQLVHLVLIARVGVRILPRLRHHRVLIGDACRVGIARLVDALRLLQHLAVDLDLIVVDRGVGVGLERL